MLSNPKIIQQNWLNTQFSSYVQLIVNFVDVAVNIFLWLCSQFCPIKWALILTINRKKSFLFSRIIIRAKVQPMTQSEQYFFSENTNKKHRIYFSQKQEKRVRAERNLQSYWPVQSIFTILGEMVWTAILLQIHLSINQISWCRLTVWLWTTKKMFARMVNNLFESEISKRPFRLISDSGN